jgi:single-strand DNA-binding protein
MNIVILRGTLSRTPDELILGSGDRLVRYEVTTRSDDAPAATAPVAWVGAPASAVAMGAGDEVVVVGRVRRRWFRRGGITESRIEVDADEVVPARRAKRARDVVARTAALLGGDE